MTNFAEFLKAEVGVPRGAVTSPRQSTNRRRRRRSSVDFLGKRLPAQVGRYLEGVQFPPARRSCLEGSSATVCRGRSPISCARGCRKASTAAPRTSCLPSGGGVSLSADVCYGRLELSTSELLRTPLGRSSQSIRVREKPGAHKDPER